MVKSSVSWVAAQTTMDNKELDQRRVRCKPKRKPGVYESVDSWPNSEMDPCAEMLIGDLLLRDVEVFDISTLDLSIKNRVVMLAEKTGSVHLVNVIAEGDRSDWDLQKPAARSFSGDSCLNNFMLCDVTSVKLTEGAFWTVDRHRITSFKFSYLPNDPEVINGQFGHFNTAPASPSELNFPTSLDFYRPLNATQMTTTDFIIPAHADAKNSFLFVSDTGNHRIVFYKLLGEDTETVVATLMGQFGLTGIACDNSSGLHWPHGLAVEWPAVEMSFEPVFANVFVADRQNSRLVKLNLGYPTWEDAFASKRLSLMFGGSYGGKSSGLGYGEALQDPVGVCKYRHYIFVAEGLGNVITVLKVHQSRFNEILLVTRLSPVQGIQLTGYISVTPAGYLWYTYLKLPLNFGVASIFLDEALRESPPHKAIDDIINECQNETWYQEDLLTNHSLYFEWLGYLYNTSRINWLWPTLPGYADIQVYNLTIFFDIPALNKTIFDGRMTICRPPVVSTTPAMLSADKDGWAGQGDGVARGSAQGRQAAAATLCLALVAAAPRMLLAG